MSRRWASVLGTIALAVAFGLLLLVFPSTSSATTEPTPVPTETVTATATATATATVTAQPEPSTAQDCTDEQPCTVHLEGDTEAWMLGAAALLVLLAAARTVSAWGRDG